MIIRRWFGYLVIVAPLHMVEQLFMGIDELYEIQRISATYHSLFDDPNYATVLLVAIVGTIVLLLAYGLLLGGRRQLLAVGFFGLVAVGEVHHLVSSLVNLAYSPGTLTAIPFVLVGIVLLREVVRERMGPNDVQT